ncbi:MAG: hypothetical protein J6M93_06305 [Succinivibrio sp.]|nr:hypothetical protein [Succinivibrio sp.]
MKLGYSILALSVILLPLTLSSAQADQKKAPQELRSTRLIEHNLADEISLCHIMSDKIEGVMSDSDLKAYTELFDSSGKSIPHNIAVTGEQICFTGLRGGQKYQTVIKKGLKSVSGLILREECKKEYRTSDCQPSLSMESGNLLPASLNQKTVNITSVNLSKIKVFLYRFDKNDISTAKLFEHLRNDLMPWELLNILGSHAVLLGEHVYETAASPNEKAVTGVKLTDFTAEAKEGTYLIFAADANLDFDGLTTYSLNKESKEVWLSKLLFISDLGITTYQGNKSLTVAVRKLDDATPVSDATVEVFAANNALLATAKTDNDGYAVIPEEAVGGTNASALSTVAVTRDNDFNMLDLRGLQLWFDHPNGRTRLNDDSNLEVFCYTDRGIYRPGETVHFNALIREHDLKASSLQALTLKITRPDDVVYETRTVTNIGAGIFSHDFSIPDRDSQGNWSIRLYLDDKNLLSATDIPVSDFKPRLISSKILTSPDTFIDSTAGNKVEVQANFNYGAPGIGLTAFASAEVKPDPKPVAGYEDYFFGPVADRYGDLTNYSSFDRQTTDEKGIVPFSFNIKNALYARKVNFSSSVYDTNGNASDDSIEFKVKINIPLIGVRQDPKNDKNFEFVSVMQSGKAAKIDINYQLYALHTDYQYVYEHGHWQYIRNERKIPVASGTVAGGDKTNPAVQSFDLKNGQYLLVARNQDYGSETSFKFYKGYALNTETYLPQTIVLSTDKQDYKIGENINLEFESLIDGYADLALGSNGVQQISHHEVKKGHNTITFKADRSFDQGIHALLTIYAPLTGGPEVGRVLGLTYIPIDSSEKILDVALEGPKQLKPAESADFTLKVKGGTGDIYYTAALVDTGILQLTDYKAPSPDKTLLEPVSYQTRINDMYGYLIRQVKEKGQGYGDEGMAAMMGMGAETLKALTKRNVVLYRGVTKLENGEGTIHFDIPKHQGGLKLMVVAANDEAVGSKALDLTVRDKAVVEARVPYLLHTDDNLDSALSVHNLEVGSGDFSFEVKCDGAISCIMQDNRLTVEKDSLKLMALGVSADKAGTGTISYKVSADGFSYEDSHEITVVGSIPQTFTQKLYTVQPNENLTIDAYAGFADGVLASVQSGPLPYVDITAITRSLLEDYNYNVYSLISAVGGLCVMKAGDRSGIDASKIQDRIDKLQNSINSQGFVRSSIADEGIDRYATVLAFSALLEARDNGYGVNHELLDTMVSRLNQLTDDDDETVKAAALEALALGGEPNLAKMRYCFDNTKSISPLAYASYIRAFARSGDEDRLKTAQKRASATFANFRNAVRGLKNAKNTDEYLKRLKELRNIETVVVSSPDYDLCEIMNAALIAKDDKTFGDCIHDLVATTNFKNYIPDECLGSLLRTQALLGDQDIEVVKIPKDGKVNLKNEGKNVRFFTLGQFGYPQKSFDNPKGSSISTVLYTPDGVALHTPYSLKQNEQLVMLVTLSRPKEIFSNQIARIMLPTGFEVERVIDSDDENYEMFGNICSVTDYKQSDFGATATLTPYGNTKTLKFALLVRPSVRGELTLPQIIIEDLGVNDGPVHSEVSKIEVK